MSLEAVNQFLQKVSEEPQLQEQVAKAMESENHRQAVVELAAKQGYQFTAEEIGQEIQKRQDAAIAAGELNEEELEAVAGGACSPLITKTVVATVKVTISIATNKKW